VNLLLAIDQSTSATKAMLLREDGRLADLEALEHQQHYPQPGWVEHDAAEIWRNVLSVSHTLCRRNEERVDKILGVSLTNQRETFVAFDRASGAPLAPAIVWQCRRGDPICAELRAAGYEEEVVRKTGLRIDSYFSGSKMSWLLRERPEIARQVASGEACLATIDAYLIHRLTKGAVFATDPTNASRTLLYDIGARAWDPALAKMFQVPLHALPEVRDNTSLFGTTDLGGALPRELPICGVLGDSQASLFAQACYAAAMPRPRSGAEPRCC
jgi:glycerol kinase